MRQGLMQSFVPLWQAEGPAEGTADSSESSASSPAAAAATDAEPESSGSASPAGAGAGGEAGSSAGAAPASGREAPREAPTDWRDKRIATLTARLTAMQEKLNAAVTRPAADNAAATLAATQAEIERLANAKAAELAPRLAAEKEYAEQCNAVVAEGRKVFGQTEFDNRVQALKNLADVSDPRSVTAYTTLIQSCVETGSAEKLLFQLGGDLNRAEQLMNLSPVKLAVALAKMTAVAEAAAPSGAPKPITPVGGKGAANTDIDPTDPDKADGLDTVTWMKRREAAIEKARRAAEAA